jgi:hypothetical protein
MKFTEIAEHLFMLKKTVATCSADIRVNQGNKIINQRHTGDLIFWGTKKPFFTTEAQRHGLKQP